MFKVVYLLTRREDQDEAAFAAHWRDVHAPLVRQLPGLLRYTIGPVTGPSGDDRPAFDGVGEAWYADEAAYVAARDSVAMAAALAARPAFTSRIVTAFVDEHVVIDRAETDRP